MSLTSKLASLESVLSGAASVSFRGDPEFSKNVLRWSQFAAPQPGAIVNVAVETDVQKSACQVFL